MGKTKRKFVDKKRDATFTLAHRSAKDPLAADNDASQRILLPANEAAVCGCVNGGGVDEVHTQTVVPRDSTQ